MLPPAAVALPPPHALTQPRGRDCKRRGEHRSNHNATGITKADRLDMQPVARCDCQCCSYTDAQTTDSNILRSGNFILWSSKEKILKLTQCG